MLIPNKHSHPDETVLAAATVLLRALMRERVMQYDELLNKLKGRDGAAQYLFAPAVSLLFLLGLVDYLPHSDAFEYLGAS